MSRNYCPTCGKVVYFNEQIKALGQTWHKRCFVCHNCGKRLNVGQYSDHDNLPYCNACYSRLFKQAGYGANMTLSSYTDQREVQVKTGIVPRGATKPARTIGARRGGVKVEDYPRCEVCHRDIKDTPVSVGGKYYHESCFNCARCGKNLSQIDFYEDKGKFYCENCMSVIKGGKKTTTTVAPAPPGRGTKASSPSIGNRMRTSSYGMKPLAAGVKTRPADPGKKGAVTGEISYGRNALNGGVRELPKCAACHREIKGTPLRVEGKDYHEACFNCARCSRNIATLDFYEDGGNFYCEDCIRAIKREQEEAKKMYVSGYGKKRSYIGKALRKENKTSDPSSSIKGKGKSDEVISGLPKCAACSLVIKGTPLRVEGKDYHEACFNCARCSKNIADEDFYEEDGKFYCEDCIRIIKKEEEEAKKRGLGKGFSKKTSYGSGAGKYGTIGARSGTSKYGGSGTSKYGSGTSKYGSGTSKYGSGTSKYGSGTGRYGTISSRSGYGSGKSSTVGSGTGQTVVVGSPSRKGSTVYTGTSKKVPGSTGGTTYVVNSSTAPSNKVYTMNSKRPPTAKVNTLRKSCFKCHRPIIGDAVRVEGKDYHKACFTCSNCGRELAETDFYKHEGRYYCERCVEDIMNVGTTHLNYVAPNMVPKVIEKEYPICARCYGSIRGDVFRVDGKDYHEACFICEGCSRNLAHTDFYLDNGKYYCSKCIIAIQRPKLTLKKKRFVFRLD